METNKVVRSEAGRIVRRMEQTAYLLLVVMALFTCAVCACVCDRTTRIQDTINSKDEVAIEHMFDTQALETWCKGEDMGQIRMVGAWVYSNNSNGTTTLEDEQGYLWDVEGQVDDSFLLLWLVDNHTPEVEDDEIIKVWSEWYN